MAEYSSDLPKQNLTTEMTDNSVQIDVLIVVLAIIGIGAVTGNTVNLFVLNKVKFATESQLVLLRILCFVDFTIGVLCFFIIVQLIPMFIGSEFLCKILFLCFAMPFSMSITTLTFVAIDKAVFVLKPLRYHAYITPLRTKLLSFGVFLTIVPWSLYMMSADSLLDQVNYLPEIQLCIPSFTNSKRMAFLFLSGVIWFLIPLIIILCCYFWLGLIARQQNRRVADACNNESCKELRKREWKGVKLAIAITAAFLLPWSIAVALFVSQTVFAFQISEKLELISFVFMISGSWNNTIIYFIFYKEIRNTAFSIIFKRVQCLLSFCKK